MANPHNVIPSQIGAATQNDLNITNSIASGSPKGVYATLTDLQTALPTGDTNIYLVSADGNWYYWNGSAWIAGGTYQSTAIADKSILLTKLSFDAIEGYPSIKWYKYIKK